RVSSRVAPLLTSTLPYAPGGSLSDAPFKTVTGAEPATHVGTGGRGVINGLGFHPTGPVCRTVAPACASGETTRLVKRPYMLLFLPARIRMSVTTSLPSAKNEFVPQLIVPPVLFTPTLPRLVKANSFMLIVSIPSST